MADRAARRTGRDRSDRASRARALAVGGLLIGGWAMLPPYLGPSLATEARVEFVDHIVPGVVILTVSAAMLGGGRRVAGAATASFAAGLVVMLAGLWMVATHVPLVAQARRGQAPIVATVWHTLPGVAVLTLGLVWAFLASAGPPASEPAPTD